jgi:hypothetical protein
MAAEIKFTRRVAGYKKNLGIKELNTLPVMEFIKKITDLSGKTMLLECLLKNFIPHSLLHLKG